jgi:hypothetical protein
MKAGDPIWYRHVPRGGYGFGFDVPGEFVRATERRVTVRVFKKDGARVDRVVMAHNVRPRDPEAVFR